MMGGYIDKNNSVIRHNSRCINGNNNQIYGNNNTINGRYNQIYGDNNKISGHNNQISGDDNKITGNNNTATGNDNIFYGTNNTYTQDFIALKPKPYYEDPSKPTYYSQEHNYKSKNHGSFNLIDEPFNTIYIDCNGDATHVDNNFQLPTYLNAAFSDHYSKIPPKIQDIPITKEKLEITKQDIDKDSIAKENEKECGCCYNNKARVALGCSHMDYCAGCTKEWMKKNNTCPTCRAEIKIFIVTI